MALIVVAGMHACISEARIIGKRETGEHQVRIPTGRKIYQRALEEDLYDWEQIGGDVDAGTTNYKESDFRVDISGDGSTVATGSPLFNSLQGLVRVSRINASTQTWEAMGSTIVGDEFYGAAGQSISLSYDGTILAVGFPSYNKLIGSSCCHNSTVRVYQWNATISDWNQLGPNIFDIKNIPIIDGIEYVDHFRSNQAGWAVSLSEDGMVVAVGAPNYFVSDTGYRGQVRVYQYDKPENEWKELGQPISEDGYGYSVALSGDGTTLVIGNPHAEIDTGTGNNITRTKNGNAKAFKFQNADSAWELHGNVIVGDQEWGRTGESVAISTNGGRVAIGHPGHKATGSGGSFGSGLVRVYQIDTNNSVTSSPWNQIGSDIIPNFELEWEDGYGFGDGRSVSMSGDGYTLAVAAPGLSINDVSSGLVRVFQFNDTKNDWDKVGKTIPGESAYNSHEGRSDLVSLSSDGNRLVVGAPIHIICIDLDFSCTYSPRKYSNWTGHVRVFDFTEVSTTPSPTANSPTHAPTTANPTTDNPTGTTANPTTNNPTDAQPTIAPITFEPTRHPAGSHPTLEPTGHSASSAPPSTETPTLSETTVLPTTLPPTGRGSGSASIPGKLGRGAWLLLLLLNPLLLIVAS